MSQPLASCELASCAPVSCELASRALSPAVVSRAVVPTAPTDPVRVTRSEDVPPRPGPGGVVLTAVLGTGYLALLLAALWGSGLVFSVLGAVVVVAELGMLRAGRLVLWGLRQAELGLPYRLGVLALGLVVLLGQSQPSSWLLVVGAVGSSLVAVSCAVTAGLLSVTSVLRKSPVLSWNLPVVDLHVAPVPRWLVRWGGTVALPAQGLVLVGGGASAATGATWPLLAAALASSVLVLVAVASALATAWSARRARTRALVPRAVEAAVAAYSPDVVLYFGGPPEALYQVEMWLHALESAAHRTVVLLRDRESWRRIAPTSLPVVCIEAGTALVSFDLSSVRGALFVANAATNIHLIRKGGMRTAFIGHGDSDKASSSNPFVRVYDEVWVAGPAGAERYQRSGVTDVLHRVRQVGRPTHLAPRGHDAGPAGTEVTTVVYAPTWEGWGDEPHHSSLPHDGLRIVEALLECPGVRVVYRPHPLTGTRDAAVRRAHDQVVGRLRAAGAPRERWARPTRIPVGIDDVQAMLSADSPVGGPGGGPVDGPGGGPVDGPGGGHRAEAGADTFWRAFPATTHRVAEGAWPGLDSVLDMADVLVADVSGVVSDWLVRDRPLAVTNPQGLAQETFRTRFPSSRAALVLGAGGEGLTQFLEGLRTGVDPTAADRGRSRALLLGEGDAGDSARFQAALDALTGNG